MRSIVGDGDAFSDRMARNLLYATWIGLVGDCMAEAERAEFEGRSPQVEWPTLDDLRAAASERSDRLIQRLETWSAQISEFGRHPRHSDRAQAAFLKVLLLEPEVAVPGAQEVVARAFKGRKQKG
ncbi:hypothetical protein [Rhodovibrio sodomensis]|uniref:hypothetical protein n=1 Tax=Rhodovibrio sodomensis TaxID=1088 RepID=UPI001903B8E0|nr:hypothetical protein [Rhodovibrio sodomensis]